MKNHEEDNFLFLCGFQNLCGPLKNDLTHLLCEKYTSFFYPKSQLL